MGIVIGIDVGGSTTKIVGLNKGKITIMFSSFTLSTLTLSFHSHYHPSVCFF